MEFFIGTISMITTYAYLLLRYMSHLCTAVAASFFELLYSHLPDFNVFEKKNKSSVQIF